MSKNNRGYVTLEVTLIMPIFIFAMVTIYHIMQCKIAENIIYEASVETAEYMAEFSYMSTDNALLANIKFEDYVDDKKILEKYVDGGVDGVNFIGTKYDEDGYVVLKVNYTLKVNSPLVSGLKKTKTFTLRQKEYIGDQNDAKEREDENDRYVYITDNQSVYHNERGCTHLTLSKHTVNVKSACTMKYQPCEFCVKNADVSGRVIVTEQGDRYHMDENCSGLKRSVKRVKLSEVSGLGECSRCGY